MCVSSRREYAAAEGTILYLRLGRATAESRLKPRRTRAPPLRGDFDARDYSRARDTSIFFINNADRTRSGKRMRTPRVAWYAGR